MEGYRGKAEGNKEGRQSDTEIETDDGDGRGRAERDGDMCGMKAAGVRLSELRLEYPESHLS